ncbi:MAG: cysteine-rich CWC family protein [Ferruginibacter sp.]
MYKHDIKTCPRCNRQFECKAGSITQCQCSSINLSAEERIFAEAGYDDCLCINCLHILREEYLHFKEKYVFQK